MQPRILIIAGSDSGGGAGIQADIKTVTALGGYAATAITALTAQNTLAVQAINDVPAEFVGQQIESVLTDIGADVIKTGMLHKAEIIQAVANSLKQYPDVPKVVDPVMIAKGGQTLLQTNAINALKERLIPGVAILTPNIPEAEILTGMTIATTKAMEAAGRELLTMGAKAVLMKGGHLSGSEIIDILVSGDSLERFSSPRIDTQHTHGTGCTLASAIATGLAHNLPLIEAVEQARTYVLEAIKSAPGLGKGHGPLNHLVKTMGYNPFPTPKS